MQDNGCGGGGHCGSGGGGGGCGGGGGGALKLSLNRQSGFRGVYFAHLKVNRMCCLDFIFQNDRQHRLIR